MNHPTAIIVFDMDDTLYLERDFVRSGYRAICDSLCQQGLLLDTDAGFEWLWNRFEQGLAANAFGALSEHFKLHLSPDAISDLVTLYRTHATDIHLSAEIQSLLSDLVERDDVRLALITDGPATMQESKFYALGLDAPELDIAPAIFTARLGTDAGKPSKIAYELIQQSQPTLPPNHFVYIGDNLEKDFVAPNALGWHSICLQQEGQVHADNLPPAGGEPHEICTDMETLSTSLRRWIDAVE